MGFSSPVRYKTRNLFYNTHISERYERHKTPKNMHRAKLIDSRQSGQFSGQPCFQDLSSSLHLEQEGLRERRARRDTLGTDRTTHPSPRIYLIYTIANLPWMDHFWVANCFIYIRIRNSFPLEWLCTGTRFESEACSNSEMGHWLLSLI